MTLDTPVDMTWNLGPNDGPKRALASAMPMELDEAAKGQLYSQWRRGMSADALAVRYSRSSEAIDRVIQEIRAHRILDQSLEYIPSDSFDAADAAEIILAPMPADPAPRASAADVAPPGLDPYLAGLYESPLLSPQQEAHLFRKMNFLKFQACQVRDSIEPERARAADLDEIERLQSEALDVKNQIIRANLRLVVSIARKRVHAADDLFELVSDGNMSLIRAVENFDFSRGFKFSTYATWAIRNNFSRAFAEANGRRHRFVTGREEIFENAADNRSSEIEHESDHLRDQKELHTMLGRLDDRERRILMGRYGIGGSSELTLAQLGRELGITKERVRQLEWRAEQKLRKFAGARWAHQDA